MNVLLCFLNLFKPRNWLILFALVLNMFLCVIFGEFIFISIIGMPVEYSLYVILGIIGVYLLVEIILMTPFGEWVLRKQFNVGLVIRNENSALLYEIFDNIVEKARKNNKFLSKRIKLYIQESNEINAFAFGSRTVCVTRGLLNLEPYKISGILAHEFGHINYYDSYISLMTIHGNALLVMLIKIAIIPFRIFATIFDILLGVLFKSENFRVFRNILIYVVNVFITIVNLITNICFYFRSRMIEYRADAYTSLIGEKNNLIEGLKTILEINGEPKFNLLEAVFSSHPSTSKRIEKLKLLPNREY